MVELIFEELEVHEPEPVAAVVVDVLSPGFALDVDEHERLWLRELDGHQWGQVT